MTGGLLGAIDWQPWAILASFVASMAGIAVALAKTREEAGAKRDAKAALDGSTMATLAFKSLEGRLRDCDGRCADLEERERGHLQRIDDLEADVRRLTNELHRRTP